MTISLARANELFGYDPETGAVTWRCGKRRGKRAGSTTGDRAHVKADGRFYQLHRLIWLMQTGVWPTFFIDHKDTDGMNNRWENLREADPAQSVQNRKKNRTNRSGFKGVTQTPVNRWAARIGANEKTICLGHYDTPEEAHAAYCAAATRLYGEYARFD